MKKWAIIPSILVAIIVVLLLSSVWLMPPTSTISPTSQLAAISGTGSGLVAYYTFDEGSGTTAGDSSGNNNGTLTNGPMWVSGTDAKIGSGAVSFDGVNDYVKIGSTNATNLSQKSVFMWVYHRSNKVSDVFDGGYWTSPYGDLFQVDTVANRFDINVKNSAATVVNCFMTGASPVGSWQYIGYTYDGSNVRCYANGTQVGSNHPLTGTLAGTAYQWTLGSRNAGNANSLVNLDDVRIYNRALSAQEISDLYALGSVTPSPSTNQSPTVSAGSNQTITLPQIATLTGTASDDGLPTGSTLTNTWSKLSGSGTVTFTNPNSLTTTATFSTSGNYTLRLSASDSALTSTSDITITVNPSIIEDTTAPIISNVQSTSITTTGATITWTTNETSDTQIDYGLTTTYGSQTTLASQLTTSHTQTLTTLSPNTTYHYRVRARDGAGNLAMSGDLTFITATQAQTTGSHAWYVDNAATGLNNGTSWTTAWNSFASIKWCRYWETTCVGIKGGDTLYISGGQNSKTYNETLTILPNLTGIDAVHRVTVTTGKDAGHNGEVIIDCQNVRPNGIAWGGTKYITLSGEKNTAINLLIRNCTDSASRINGWGIDSVGSDVSNNIAEYVEVADSNNGIRMRGKNNEIRNSYIHGIRGDGAVDFSVVVQEYDINKIHDSRIQLNSDYTGGSGPDGIQGGSGVTVYNNNIYSGEGPLVGTLVNGTPAYQHQDAIQPLGSYWKIYNNTILNMGNSAIESGSWGFPPFPEHEYGHYRFYNNVVAITDPRVAIWSRGVEWLAKTGCTKVSDFVIANNTFVDIYKWAAIRIDFNGFNDRTPVVENIYIENNLVYNSGANTYMPAIQLTIGSGMNNVVIDYNNLNAGLHGDNHIYIGASKDASGAPIRGTSLIQAHNRTGVPAFVSYSERTPTNNFQLAGNDTAAVDLGTNLSNYFTSDFAGISRPQGSAWDIGAYEYYSGQPETPPTPTNALCSTTLNQCTAGIFSDTGDTSTNYLWSCVGSNGGTTASCSLPISLLPDSTPPTISIISPTNNQTVSGSSVSLSASASDPAVSGQTISGLAGVQFKLDTVNIGLELTTPNPGTAVYEGQWNTLGVTNGTHTLTATAQDAAGNRATSTISITVANTVSPPTVTPPPPASGGGSSGGGGGGGYTPSSTGTLTPTIPQIPVASTTPAVLPSSTTCRSALSSTQITSILNLLKSFNADQAIITKVQASLTCKFQVPSSNSQTISNYQFTRNLKLGMKGEDVRQLQMFLNTHGYKITDTSSGSPGKETIYFGFATKAALIKFQNAYKSEILAPTGLTNGTGFFGPSTLRKMNEWGR